MLSNDGVTDHDIKVLGTGSRTLIKYHNLQGKIVL